MRPSLFRHLAMILLIAAAPASQAKPIASKSAATKKPFSLGGERLPIIDPLNDEGEPRNERWPDIARVLRVRVLRVYQWPSAYNVAGDAEKQKQKTLTQLKAAGYQVESVVWDWNVPGYFPTRSGFRARRGPETLSAMWNGNGSFLFLYWGHTPPLTPERQRDDGLIAAAIAGREADAQKFLRQGANPNAVDYGGASVLVLAASNQRAAVVAQLLAARQARSVNTAVSASDDFSAALNFAAAANDIATLKVLLDAGATPAQIGAALQIAATTPLATEAAAFLAARALPADLDRALVAASFDGMWRGDSLQYPDVVKLLLTYKPPQKALNAALLAASQDDQLRVVPLLLSAGANIETRDDKGRTILLIAASGVFHNIDLRKLLDAGADVKARDNAGNTVLMWAVEGGFASEIKLLLARGADPRALNNQGQSALDWAQSRLKKASGSEKANSQAIVQLLQAADK